MKTELRIAQKGLVLSRDKQSILAIHYSDNKYLADKLSDKYGLPGGQTEFGELPEETLIREVREETGIIAKPLTPIHVYTWTYQKEKTKKQIIAVAWLCHFVKGSLCKPAEEKESTIDYCKWLPLKPFPFRQFLAEETPVIRHFLKYRKKNPFDL